MRLDYRPPPRGCGGRCQVSGWGRGCWRLAPAPPPPRSAPGPSPAAPGPGRPFLSVFSCKKNTCCRGSRTPDTRCKQRKGKEKTPPLLIAFGWNPGCPIHYTTPAQRDTCADAGAGPGTGGGSGLERGLSRAGTGGQGEKERISGWRGGALVWGIGGGWILEGRLQGRLPSTSRTPVGGRNQKLRF